MSTQIYDLGYLGKGRYRFNDITVGFPGGGGLSLKNQTLARVAAKDFYIGIFRLTLKPSIFIENNSTSEFYREFKELVFNS